jgi:hypothetical protein
MTNAEIAKIRLRNQHIRGSEFSAPQELARWMVAMQAQDLLMSLWAFGIRLPGLTQDIIRQAADDGKIIRTHLLRPTWHFVAAENIRWLLRLSAPRIKASVKARHRELLIDEHLEEKSNSFLADTLKNSNHHTREELVLMFREAGISDNNSRTSHLIFLAELDGVICSGRIKNGRTTYALLDERIPPSPQLTEVEALSTLARKYFTSHGPATVRDFAWWSGLSAAGVRMATGEAGKYLFTLKTDSSTYLVNEDFVIPEDNTAHLLPAFDEYIISYTDRSAVLSHLHNRKAVSDNGVFRPVILVNGRVEGIWKRSVRGDKIIIETTFFRKQGIKVKKVVELAAIEYGNFTGRKAEVLHTIKT